MKLFPAVSWLIVWTGTGAGQVEHLKCSKNFEILYFLSVLFCTKKIFNQNEFWINWVIFSMEHTQCSYLFVFSKVSWDDPIWMFLYEHERIIFDYVQINFFNTQFLSTALSLIDHPWNCLSSSIFRRSMSMALFSLITRKCSNCFRVSCTNDQESTHRLVHGPVDPGCPEIFRLS